MPFYYYIENARSLAGQIEKHRLGYALDVEQRSTRESAGPKGKGLLISVVDDPATMIEFNAEKQKWIPATASGCKEGAWVGMEIENPPGPEDLARPEMVEGFHVQLANEQEWIVPVAKQFPKSITFAPDGAMIETPMERYKELCQQSDRIWVALRTQLGLLDDSEEPVTISLAESADLAMRILAVNYRIGKAEATLLGLLDTDCIAEILRWFADWPTFIEVNKARFKASGPSDSEKE